LEVKIGGEIAKEGTFSEGAGAIIRANPANCTADEKTQVIVFQGSRFRKVIWNPWLSHGYRE
jgi:hypothetical protein